MNRIKKIDGWRCVAIGLVLFGHYLYRVDIFDYFSASHYIGRLGVQIFFVISGYVITLGMIKEKDVFNSVSLKSFYIRRFFRIVPPLFLYVLVVSVLGQVRAIDIDFQDILYVVLFITNLHFVFNVGWYFEHTWSLSYEEQFYLLFPFMFVFLNKMLGIKLVFFVIAASGFCYFIDYDMAGELLRNFSLLLVGVALAKNKSTIEILLEIIGARVRSIFLFLSIVLVLVLHYGQGIIFEALEIFLLPFGVAVMFFISINFSSFIDPMLENRFSVYVGSVSYGIYLWQQLALGDHGVGPFSFLFFVFLSVLLAGLQFKYIERRLIKIGRAISNQVSDRVA